MPSLRRVIVNDSLEDETGKAEKAWLRGDREKVKDLQESTTYNVRLYVHVYILATTSTLTRSPPSPPPPPKQDRT